MLWRKVETAWGVAALVVDDRQRLAGLVLPMANLSLLTDQMTTRWPQAQRSDCDLLPQLAGQVRAYFAGQAAAFRTDLALDHCTTFQRFVLQACRQIPAGESITYGQLAAIAGSPRAARAVGQVMAANAIPLVVPCHRVVGSDGAMVGFSASDGIAAKQRLLDHEARFFAGR